MSFLSSLLNILQVVVGFGFVIFWHELGHFLAARWAGVRVEQFSVGMGHAVVSWRKGIGFKLGNTAREFEHRTKEEFERRERARLRANETLIEPTLRQKYDIAKELGIGETEYRLAWIPLGGYVKPTGQDDLRPSAEVGGDDPHAYGAKSPGKRMVIISAGVVMNIILAFFLYVGLFLSGFNAPPAIVGHVQPGSPAQFAGIGVGDQILELNGKVPHDFTKIPMGVALLEAGRSAPVKIRKPDGSIVNTDITPAATSARADGLLAIGISPASELAAFPDNSIAQAQLSEAREQQDLFDPGVFLLNPGDRITAIEGVPVTKRDIVLNERKVQIDPIEQLDAALQKSEGRPVVLTVQNTAGALHDVKIQPTFAPRFNEIGFDVAGMMPMTKIDGVSVGSVADAAQDEKPNTGLRAGDRVLEIHIDRAVVALPDVAQFYATLQQAQRGGKPLTLVVMRGAEKLTFNLKHPWSVWKATVLGIAPASAFEEPIVAHTREPVQGRPSMTDNVRLRDVKIVSIASQPVSNWYDISRIVAAAVPGEKVTLRTIDRDGVATAQEVVFTQADVERAKQNRFVAELPLKDLNLARKTSNPLTAAAWGFEDTKDSLTSVYRTIQRLVQGSVPVSSLHGPVGIFGFGQTAADRGFDWFIWFMALISANLAVVNFLPVPIVDGGLFIFLLIEKFTGRPPSPKVQSFAQLVGLILIASVFLFVTYNDLSSKL